MEHKSQLKTFDPNSDKNDEIEQHQFMALDGETGPAKEIIHKHKVNGATLLRRTVILDWAPKSSSLSTPDDLSYSA